MPVTLRNTFRSLTLVGFLYSTFLNAVSPLSWERAIELTAENNAEIIAAKEKLRSFEYRKSGSWSGYMPQVSGTLSYDYAENSGNSQSVDKNYSAGIQATQNIFSGFSDLGKTRLAEAEKNVAIAQLKAVKAKVSFQLRNAFHGVLYARDLEKLTDEILKRRSENSRLVRLRFESGRENKGSWLLSDSYFKEARYESMKSKNLKRYARRELSKVTGVEISELGEVVGTLPSPPAPVEFNPEASLQDLLADTPEYLESLSQQEAAKADVDLKEASHYPTLNLVGAISKNGPSFFPSEDERRSVGLSLSLPLFTGGRNYYATRASLASWSEATNKHAHKAREILLNLDEGYGDYIESFAKLESDESFQKAALVRAEIARKKYNAGLLSFEDWDVIENDLISRQKNYLTSFRDHIEASAKWDQLRGKGVIP